MARYIRESTEREGINDWFKLPLVLEIEEVPDYDIPIRSVLAPDTSNFKIEKTRWRTKYKVPYPVRIKNDTPFTFVGFLDRSVSFANRSRSELQNPRSSPLKGASAVEYSYTWENGYLYFHTTNCNTLKTKMIVVESIWENPEEVATFYNDLDDGLDTIVPLPYDLIHIAMLDLLRVEFNFPIESLKVEMNEPKSVQQS